MVIAAIVSAVVIILFGEITPKCIAGNYPEKIAAFSAPFLRLLFILFTPISFTFKLWALLIDKIFRNNQDDKTSQEELLMIVDEAEQEGGIDTDEGDLLRNAIEFTEIRAEDILQGRNCTKIFGNKIFKASCLQRKH